MAADKPGEVTLARQEVDLLKEADRLRIVRADVLGVAVDLLRERDADAEVGGLGKLREFERLDLRHPLSLHAGRAKVILGAGGRRRVGSGDKFAIVQQVLLHADVLAANRTVRDRAAAFFRDRSGGPRQHRAVDDRERRLKPLDVPQSHRFELML